MIRHADEDGFSTLCGITDNCSEDFFDDPNNLVGYGNEKECTCKRCMKKWEKEKKKMDEIILSFGKKIT